MNATIRRLCTGHPLSGYNRAEPVPEPSNGLDVTRRGGVGFDLGPQPLHAGVDQPGVPQVIVFPGQVEKLLPGKHLPRRAGQDQHSLSSVGASETSRPSRRTISEPRSIMSSPYVSAGESSRADRNVAAAAATTGRWKPGSAGEHRGLAVSHAGCATALLATAGRRLGWWCGCGRPGFAIAGHLARFDPATSPEPASPGDDGDTKERYYRDT